MFRGLVPNGSLEKIVDELMREAGIPISYRSSRDFIGRIRHPNLFPESTGPWHVRKMRPQDATWVVSDGKAEFAWAGEDLILESGCSNLQIVKKFPISRGGGTGVRLIVATPKTSGIDSVEQIKEGHELVTEYPWIARGFLEGHGLSARVRRCVGATEAFGPLLNGNDTIADVIIDNTETGTTLREGGWQIIHTIMTAELCLFTSDEATKLPEFSDWMDQLVLLISSVFDARQKVMIKFNIVDGEVNQILQLLGGSPTISELSGGGKAVEVIIDRIKVPEVLHDLRQVGATSIVQTNIDRFVA